MVAIWLPFVEAFEAGLWLFWVLPTEIIAVARPAIHIADDRLHRADGPAVEWPGGSRYWFWRGLQVPQRLIEEPASITVAEIDGERNTEIRRVMLERYGAARFIQDSGAEIISVDECGALYRREVPDDEPIVMVRVVNSTPEEGGVLGSQLKWTAGVVVLKHGPDATYKEYWIRVPPGVKTAKEAVAWTFGVEPAAYAPTQET